jgi:tetratricopeptide (TPR) repeat protein
VQNGTDGVGQTAIRRFATPNRGWRLFDGEREYGLPFCRCGVESKTGQSKPASQCLLLIRTVTMSLEAPDLQYWKAAVGYVELGMFQDANDQLENIDSFNRAAPEVLAVRIAVYHGLKKWELMQEVAKRLAEFEPNDIQWTISLAYATRRADSIQAAKKILLNAESKFPKEAIIKYNLACYCCQLGEI